MDVTLLGTGAPLAPGRATMGILLRAPDCRPLLIDTCGGFEVVDRLRAVGAPLDELEHVIITHRHGDHTGGVPALLLACKALCFYGQSGTLSGVRDLLGATFPEAIELLGSRPRYVEVAPDEERDIGGFRVRFFEVQHRVPTLAVRVQWQDRVFAYGADSVPCTELVDCARDADLFVCDAFCAAADFPGADIRARSLMHATAREAAEMARDAGAKALALVHLARFADPDKVLAEAREVYEGALTLPSDGMGYRL